MRTQLNIDCTKEELKAWKRSALDDDLSLAQWVKDRLNGRRGASAPKNAPSPPRDPKPEKRPEPKPKGVATPEPTKAVSMAEAFRKIQTEKESPPAEIPD